MRTCQGPPRRPRHASSRSPKRNLERVYAEVYTFNARSMHLFERVGFVREGTLRQHEYHNGARHDLHVYGLLKAEFDARYPTIFTLPDA